jgi:peptidoglycan/LPS O-acetylase OafA/YrhL
MIHFLTKRFNFIDLSPEDSTFYKGLAIMLILFHNFFHLLAPGTGENEVDFSINRVKTFLNVLYQQPEFSIQVIFSFLGHFGVQMFLFLSAYGLTKKYKSQQIDYFFFLKHRIVKIYITFLLSVIFYYLYMALIYDGIPNMVKVIEMTWESLIYKLTFVANFIPGELVKVNGPWWFISLIVQFYIIFPFMLQLMKKYGPISLLLISIVSLIATAYFQPKVNIFLAGTVLTHIPELSLGIYMGYNKRVSINYIMIIFILTIFILSNFFSFFWYFGFISITVLLLIIFQLILLKSKGKVYEFIMFVGILSMYIFFIHGFMREPWISSAKHYHEWHINIILALIFFFFILGASYLQMKIDKKLRFKIFKNS